MAYVPKDWVTGEVITEEALDHIEQGIASVVLTVTIDSVTEAFNKTWQEVHDAFVGGNVVTILRETTDGYSMDFVIKIESNEGRYTVYDNNMDMYTAASADGYPEPSVG